MLFPISAKLAQEKESQSKQSQHETESKKALSEKRKEAAAIRWRKTEENNERQQKGTESFVNKRKRPQLRRTCSVQVDMTSEPMFRLEQERAVLLSRLVGLKKSQREKVFQGA
uniref:Uncharacterized protein n=1 Tax=Ditylenchus dipsaci TaxID=166011 RepID=A0A915DDS0_9BILA